MTDAPKKGRPRNNEAPILSRTEYRRAGLIDGLEWARSLFKTHEYNQISKKYIDDQLKAKIDELTIDTTD